MAAFGEVTYDGGASEASTDPNTGNATGDSKHTLIDPNDPRLTSEVMTSNQDADAYAILPPLPDGKWRAKAKQVDIKDDKGQPQRWAIFSRPGIENGRPFFATNVEFNILDATGKNDGVKLTEYWVKTLVDARKGISQSDTLVRKMGGKPPAQSTDRQRIDLLLATLAKEPELVVETAWEAQCQSCQETAKKKGERQPRPFLLGMHRFPQLRTGGHDPMVACPICKGMARAQPRIVGFMDLSVPHNK